MERKSSYLAGYIKNVVDKKYRTRSEAASDLGIDESVLSRICSGKRPGVSESIVEKICDKLGLDKTEGVIKLFLTKHSKIKQFFLKPKKAISFRIIHSDPNDKEMATEKISATHSPVSVITGDSADAYMVSLKQRASEHILIQNNWLKKDHNVLCCGVKGGAMSPTLTDKSIIAVDFDHRTLENGNLYLLKWKNKVVVRRIALQNGYVMLCSDNADKEKYPVDICSIKKANSAKDSPVLGKVVWAMEKL